VPLALYPLLRAGALYPLPLLLGLLGLLLLAFALGGAARLVPWGVTLLGAAYVVVLTAQGEPLLVAPAYGAGLLLVAECAYAALELRRGPDERPLLRAGWIAAATLAAAAVASLPVVAAGVQGPSGLGAAVAAVVLAVLLAAPPAGMRSRRRRSR
jgi:hypothetical protein